MKKLLFFILLVSHYAIGQVNSIYPKVPYSDLQYIAVEGNNIFTSGDCDVAMLSTNDGVDWTTITMEESVINIKIVPGSNGTKAFYMTSDDLFTLDINSQEIVKVSDSNLTLMSGRFRSLEVVGNKVFVIAGGAIFQSNVDVFEWTKLADFNFNANDDYVGKSDIGVSQIFVGTHFGEVRSVHATTGEVTALFDFGDRVSKIEMVTDELGYADISGQPSFVKTTNGGSAWSNLPNMPENINPVAYGTDVIISVNTNRLYVSTDGGMTSTYIPTPEDRLTDLISAAYMTADGKLYLSGRSSMVLKTVDFATTFENLNPYNRTDLQAIHINDGDVGYAVGANGSVIKTVNKGEDWEAIELGFSTDSYLSSVASYADGRLLIGNDAGISVFQDDVLVEEIAIGTNVIFQSRLSDRLIALQEASGSYAIAISTDRGATWENKAMVAGGYYKIHQSPTGKIYIPSGTDVVYTSIDEGASWEIENFGFDKVTEVSFLDDQNGVFSHDGGLYKTTDAGLNGLTIGSGYLLANIHYFDEDLMMYTTGQNGNTTIRESENGGDSFASKGSYCTTTRGSFYDGSQTLWLAMRGGHINKHVFEALPSSTKDITISTLDIYPNPVVEGSEIFLSSSSYTEGEVEMFNISGQSILKKSILSNQPIQLDGVEKGLYILVSRFGNEISTGKLIVH